MTKKHKTERKVLGPILTIGLGTLALMIISLILSLLKVEGHIADTSKQTLEMTMVTINNIFSKDGIRYLLSSVITNFQILEPLALLVVSLIASSILDASGLLKHLFSPLRKFSTSILIFLTLLISIVLTFFGEYSFIVLLPIIGIVYKYACRSPKLGILVAFIGMTCGFGTGIIYNYNTYFLGTITQISASIEIDPNFTYDVLSCLYIMIVSTFIITFIATSIINKYLVPKIKKVQIEEDEIKTSNKGLWVCDAIVMIFLVLITIMILPGGILLDNSQSTYIAKLMSPTSPFKDGIIVLALIVIMICGAVYGKISGNIKKRMDYNTSLYKNFENVGYVFVLMFFASIMISVLNWTNIGIVIASFLINIVSSLQVSGTILIIIFFIFNIIISILIPNSITKWSMTAPLIVPLFMRSNITPEFTQFIFSVSDGIGKAMSPFFIYFVIMLGFLQKYNDNNEEEITIVNTLKMILPIVLFLAFIWLILIVCWNIVGLPLGIETYATL